MPFATRASTAEHVSDSPRRWEITSTELRTLREELGRIGTRGTLEATLSGLANWALALIDARFIAIGVSESDNAEPIVRSSAGDAAEVSIGSPLNEAIGFAHSARGWLRVPIVVHDIAVGAVIAVARSDHPLEDSDGELLFLLASQAGFAIAHARADRAVEEALERERYRAEQLGALSDIGRSIARMRRIGDVLDFTVGVLTSRFEYEQATIYLRDGADAPFVLRAISGRGPRPGTELDMTSATVSAWVAQSGEPQMIADRSDLLRSDSFAKIDDNEQIDNSNSLRALSELGVPIGRGQVEGVLSLAASTLNAFDQTDLSLIGSIADELSIAIDNVRLLARVREDAVAAERAHMARELHDDTAQQLVAIGRRIDLIRMETSPEIRDAKLDEVRDQIDATLIDVRRISRNLRPMILEDLGLVAAIEALTADVRRSVEPSIRFQLTGETRPLPTKIELALFRICQEAMGNAIRHAGSSRIDVILAFEPRTIELVIRDDGKGFVVPASLRELERGGGMGLLGLRDRAREAGGELTIVSAPGAGTTLRVRVPGI